MVLRHPGSPLNVTVSLTDEMLRSAAVLWNRDGLWGLVPREILLNIREIQDTRDQVKRLLLATSRGDLRNSLDGALHWEQTTPLQPSDLLRALDQAAQLRQ